MKTNANWAIMVGALAGLLVGGGRAAGADFVLTGSDHLNVTTRYTLGLLFDASTADVLRGGDIQSAYVNDEATLRIPLGGGSIDSLRAYETSSVVVSGGSIVSLRAYETSRVAVSGRGVVQQLWAYETSSVVVSGGTVGTLDAYATSSMAVSGGSVYSVYARDATTVDISGGSVDYVRAFGTSNVDISGGSISNIIAFDTSTITLHGSDFRASDGLAMDGETVLGTGVLTGKWLNGTPWLLSVYAHASGATILAIPEPATMGLLGLGALGQLGRRRGRPAKGRRASPPRRPAHVASWAPAGAVHG